MLTTRPNGTYQVHHCTPKDLPEGVPAQVRTQAPLAKTNPIGRPHTEESRRHLSQKAAANWEERAKRKRRSRAALVEATGSEAKADDVETFTRLHCEELKENVGGGKRLPKGVVMLVESAALHKIAALEAQAIARRKGDAKALKIASEFLTASRGDLIAAHELCARYARAREQRIAMRETASRGDEPVKPIRKHRKRKTESLED